MLPRKKKLSPEEWWEERRMAMIDRMVEIDLDCDIETICKGYSHFLEREYMQMEYDELEEQYKTVYGQLFEEEKEDATHDAIWEEIAKDIDTTPSASILDDKERN